MPPDDLRAERDFYARLLELAEHDSPAALAEDALQLVADRARAQRAYLELGTDADVSFSAVRGLDSDLVADVRRNLSTSVMREALDSGLSVETKYAAGDDRFRDAPSVRRNRIEAVLCVPIGLPPCGVVYLQGHDGEGPFPEDARAWAERFARHLAPVARRIVALAEARAPDPTLVHRARLVGSDALVGQSQALADLLRLATTVAKTEAPLLLTGPAGSGKATLAQVIARSGPRAERAFVRIDCGLAPDLDRALHEAHGGTLLMHDVELLAPRAIARLLAANVRLIGTTTKTIDDLPAFVPVTVPALQDRRADIPRIAERLVDQQRDHHALGARRLSLSACQVLAHAEWPGNVPQLGNTVLAGAIRALAEGATAIEHYHLFPERGRDPDPSTWHSAVRTFQRQLLREALAASDGNVTAAAKRLGLARSHAFELVKDFGLRENP